MMLGTTRREDLFLFRGSRPHAPLDHRGARPETGENPIFLPTTKLHFENVTAETRFGGVHVLLLSAHIINAGIPFQYESIAVCYITFVHV